MTVELLKFLLIRTMRGWWQVSQGLGKRGRGAGGRESEGCERDDKEFRFFVFCAGSVNWGIKTKRHRLVSKGRDGG